MESIQPQGQARPMLRMIAASGRSVAYHPNFACITGSAISALLLQQMIFWWDVKKCQRFYKFKIPAPKHKAYSDGDSWCEELALTRHEFDTALKRIGTKIDAQHTREAFYKFQMPRIEDFTGFEDGYAKALEDAVKHFIAYWTDSDRKTWYEINDGLIEQFINLAMEPKAGIQLYLSKSRFRLYIVNRESGFTYTENTTEKNSIEEKTLRVSGQSPSHAVAGSDEPPRTPPNGVHAADAGKMVAPSQDSIEDPLQSSAKVSPSLFRAVLGFTCACCTEKRSQVYTDKVLYDIAVADGQRGILCCDRCAATMEGPDYMPMPSDTPASSEITSPAASLRAEMGKLLSERNPVTPEPPAPPRRVIADTPAPTGCEWWYSAEGVTTVAHLLKGGKGRPLCKPKHWKYPNKCMQQAAYVLCEECQRVAAEPKAEKVDTIVKPLNDAVAKYIQEIDIAFADAFTGALAQIIAGIWRTKLGRDKLTADDYAAIARSLEPDNEKGFIRWYKVQCKDCSIPNDKVKLRKWYAQFVTQTNGDNNGNSGRPKKDYGFGPKSK